MVYLEDTNFQCGIVRNINMTVKIQKACIFTDSPLTGDIRSGFGETDRRLQVVRVCEENVGVKRFSVEGFGGTEYCFLK